MGRGGEKSEGAQQDQPRLEEDPLFAELLGPDFKETEYASRVLAESSAAAQVKVRQLEAGIAELSTRIAEEVLTRQDELLSHASSLRNAEAAVQGIVLAAESLQSSLQTISSDIMEPFQEIQEKTLHLEELQNATDLLRHVLQSLKLTQRLRSHLGAEASGSGESLPELGVLELGKAGKLLTDIAAVSREADLSGVDVIAAETRFLANTRRQVTAQAEALLQKGMESLSQTEVGSALQIFFNLQELHEAVQGLVQGYASELEKSLQLAVDPKRLAALAGSSSSVLLGSHGTTRISGASQKVQEALWQKLASFMEQLRQGATAVWHLQRVLAKKRDPLSHVLFLDVLLEGTQPVVPLTAFWSRVTEALKSSLEDVTAAGRGGSVRDALVHGFPRMAALFDDFFAKLHQDTDVKGVAPALSQEQQAELLEATGSCQNLYLAALLTRVSDAVNAAFPGGNRALPTAAELHKCIGRLHEELKAVRENPRLAAVTAQAVGNALHMLAEKVEYMSATGQELKAVMGACTSAQLRNLTLANQLQEVSRSVATLLPRMPAQATAALRSSLEVLEAGAVELVMPLMRALVERGEALILKIHEQGFGREDIPAVTSASSYMQELSRHLSHSRLEYLSKFSPPANPQNSASVGAVLTQRFASRLLVFFVRHASLLRPLSQAGKLQLAKDVAELEEAVGNNLWPLEQLGPPQRTLRAFRRLLFLETGAIPGNPLLGELPTSVVLHHLYSRAPEAIQSPHLQSGFSPEQYSLWLDQHSMPEVLRYIKSALEASSEKAGEEPASKDIHGIMLQLCAS